MKKVLVFILLVSLFASCQRGAVPTLIIAANGAVVNIPELGVSNKDLGSTEFTSYSIGTFKANVKQGGFDTTFTVDLKVDSLLRIDISGGKYSAASYKR